MVIQVTWDKGVFLLLGLLLDVPMGWMLGVWDGLPSTYRLAIKKQDVAAFQIRLTQLAITHKVIEE